MTTRRATPLTRLVNADPSWVGVYPDGDLDREPTRVGIMIAFDCPIHDSGCRVAVPIRNPVDGGPSVHAGPLWDRTGKTFETLSLAPSIRVLQGADGCRWHGYVTDGAFVTCADAS